MLNRPAPYTEGLRFSPANDGDAPDPEVTMISQAMLDQMNEKAKDLFSMRTSRGMLSIELTRGGEHLFQRCLSAVSGVGSGGTDQLWPETQ
jgi:hypothetical protein